MRLSACACVCACDALLYDRTNLLIGGSIIDIVYSKLNGDVPLLAGVLLIVCC